MPADLSAVFVADDALTSVWWLAATGFVDHFVRPEPLPPVLRAPLPAAPPPPVLAADAAPTAAAPPPELDECAVCLEAPRTHAMVPCGHMCACARCAKLLAADAKKRDCELLCPICREATSSVVKIRR